MDLNSGGFAAEMGTVDMLLKRRLIRAIRRRSDVQNVHFDAAATGNKDKGCNERQN
jgi:hypothetical protein